MAEKLNPNKRKTILLTGACGGLGSVIAKTLSDEYSLILHVRKMDERAEELRDTLNSTDNVLFCEADLTSEDEIRKMFEIIQGNVNNLHGLINNAGIPFSGMSWKQTASEWDHVFDVNTRAPWLVSKYAIPLIRQNESGRLIYVSSVVAHRPLPGTSAYAASKAALEGLTRAQAVELSRFGITVNCVSPGYFNTGMIDSVSAEQQNDLSTLTPAGRLGHASELAAHIQYLCSEKAAYITGQVHHINGGLYT
jgi:3-oxoacyl-[acyl-carrier protein] reductase